MLKMGVNLFAITVLLGMAFISSVDCLGTGTVVVVVDQMKSQEGAMAVALTDSKYDYDNSGAEDKPYLHAHQPIENIPFLYQFDDVPFGTYAVKIFQDKNNNLQMDFFLAIPSEPFGFSNNPKILFGAPSFDDTKFIHQNLTTTVNIKLIEF